MPYVNCPECGIRSFALAPWSTVGSCPTCEAPLAVPRQGVSRDRPEHGPWSKVAALDKPQSGLEEAQGAR
jgi:hypothetical protein